METTLGNGCVFIGSVRRKDGCHGILLRQTCEPHEIDSTDQNWQDGKQYAPTEKDMVIWIETLDAARVLQDRVNTTCLVMNGFVVADSPALPGFLETTD